MEEKIISLEQRMDRLENKMDRIEERMDRLEERMTRMEDAIYAMRAELSEFKELMHSALKKIDANFELVEKQIYNLTVQFKVLNGTVENLKGSTTSGFDDVSVKIGSLTDEISKIGTVTRYDAYYKNLKDLRN